PTAGKRVPLRRRGPHRPPAPARLARRCRLGRLPLSPRQPKGPPRGTLAPHPRLRTLLQLPARHCQRRDHRDLQDRQTAPGGEAVMSQREGTRRILLWSFSEGRGSTRGAYAPPRSYEGTVGNSIRQPIVRLPSPPTMLRTELGFCRVRRIWLPKS